MTYRDNTETYIRDLERRVAEEAAGRRRERDRADLATAEADELREQVEPTVYVARKDSGEGVYQGTHEAAVIAAARSHYWRTREHVTIDNSSWNTRQHGGVRRPRPRV